MGLYDQNPIPGAAQPPQPIQFAPTIAPPQQGAQIGAQQPSPAGYQNPYLAQIGAQPGGTNPYGIVPPSLPSNQGLENKAADLYAQALQSQFDDNKKQDRGHLGADIMGKVVGPALAAFGGYGAGQGGMQLIAKADADLKDQRNEHRQKMADTASLMNSVNNFVARTGSTEQKALAEEHKRQNAEADRTLKAQIAQAREDRLSAALGIKSSDMDRRAKFEQTKLDSLSKYRDSKLGLDTRKVDDYEKIQKARIFLQNEQFKIGKQVAEYGIDSQRQNTLDRLNAEMQKFNVAHDLAVNKLNVDIQGKMHEMSGGKPKYEGLQLLPMSNAAIQMESPETDAITQHPDVSAGNSVVNALMQEMQQQPQQGQPQQPGQAAPTPNAGAPRAGYNIAGASAKLQQILKDPNAPPAMKQKAASDFEAFKLKALGGTGI